MVSLDAARPAGSFQLGRSAEWRTERMHAFSGAPVLIGSD